MSRKKPFVLAGWKCNGTFKSMQSLLKDYEEIESTKGMDVVICPSFIHLPFVQRVVSSKNNIQKNNYPYFNIGAQNCSATMNGAFTGEISALQLKDMNINYVMIGHSERRNYYNETNEIISNKIKRALQSNMIAIVCLGESGKERKENLVSKVLSKQLKYIFKAPKEVIQLNNNKFNKLKYEEMCISQIILLYEPVWAIGTGNVCNSDMAQETHKMIRNWIKTNVSQNVSNNIRIVYGGSVKPQNVFNLIKQNDIDGVGVGGASLNGKSFVNIVTIVKQVYFQNKNKSTNKKTFDLPQLNKL